MEPLGFPNRKAQEGRQVYRRTVFMSPSLSTFSDDDRVLDESKWEGENLLGKAIMKVWTNGCFDILHRGHIELFKYAKSLGDQLIVGLDSDSKVKQDKGTNRPFNTFEDRREVLLSIKYIDDVWYFNSRNGLVELIKEYEPNILVVGSDWKGKDVVGDDIVDDVRFFDRVGNYSTTDILGVV